MKKYLKSTFLAICLVAMAFVGSAQTSLISTNNSTTLDTVTNTGVRIMGLNTVGYKETITATIVITKISGTQGGTMVPVGSDDGTNWHDISQVTKDTVTVPNQASYIKGYSFQRGWKWYGVQWTGTGTMAGSISGKLVARRTTD
jgi:hypothetical protein